MRARAPLCQASKHTSRRRSSLCPRKWAVDPKVLEWLSSYKNEELDHKDRLQTLLGRLSNDKVVWKAGIHQTAQLAKKLGKQPDITKVDKGGIPGDAGIALYGLRIAYGLLLSVLEDLLDQPKDGFWATKLGGKEIGTVTDKRIRRAHAAGRQKASLKKKSSARVDEHSSNAPPAYDTSDDSDEEALEITQKRRKIGDDLDSKSEIAALRKALEEEASARRRAERRAHVMETKYYTLRENVASAIGLGSGDEMVVYRAAGGTVQLGKMP